MAVRKRGQCVDMKEITPLGVALYSHLHANWTSSVAVRQGCDAQSGSLKLMMIHWSTATLSQQVQTSLAAVRSFATQCWQLVTGMLEVRI